MIKRTIEMLEQCEVEHNFIMSAGNKIICTICLYTDHLSNMDTLAQNEIVVQAQSILNAHKV